MRSNDGTFQDDGQVQRYVNQVNDEVDFHCFNEQMKIYVNIHMCIRMKKG